MFGVGIFEILVVLVVAVIFLGPDKLPQAIVDATKFFRAVKKTFKRFIKIFARTIFYIFIFKILFPAIQ